MQWQLLSFIILFCPQKIVGCFSRGNKNDEGDSYFPMLAIIISCQLFWYLEDSLTSEFLKLEGLGRLTKTCSYTKLKIHCQNHIRGGQVCWTLVSPDWRELQSAPFPQPHLRPLSGRWLAVWGLGRWLGQPGKEDLSCLGWRAVGEQSYPAPGQVWSRQLEHTVGPCLAGRGGSKEQENRGDHQGRSQWAGLPSQI